VFVFKQMPNDEKELYDVDLVSQVNAEEKMVFLYVYQHEYNFTPM